LDPALAGRGGVSESPKRERTESVWFRREQSARGGAPHVCDTYAACPRGLGSLSSPMAAVALGFARFRPSGADRIAASDLAALRARTRGSATGIEEMSVAREEQVRALAGSETERQGASDGCNDQRDRGEAVLVGCACGRWNQTGASRY
jgi:hypothetical protein